MNTFCCIKGQNISGITLKYFEYAGHSRNTDHDKWSSLQKSLKGYLKANCVTSLTEIFSSS